MRTLFRSLTLGLVAISAAAVMAQTHTIDLNISVTACSPGDSVHVIVDQYQVFPSIDFYTTLDGSCSYQGFITVENAECTVQALLSCTGPLASALDSVAFTGTGDTIAVTMTLACGAPCVPPAITTVTDPVTTCSSIDSIMLNVTATGTAPLSYNWSGTGAFNPDSTSQTVFVLGDVGANYHLTVSNACGSAEADVPVTVIQASNAGLDTIINICDITGPINMFTALGGTPDSSGAWTYNGSFGTPHSEIFDPTTDVTGSYNYTIVGTAPCPYAESQVYIHETTVWFADVDGDGLGDHNDTMSSCTQPVGYVSNSDDWCPSVFGTIGSACDDGNPNTTDDTLNANCVCVGTAINYDCLGIWNGPNLPGTSCTDSLGDAGTWNSACICIATPPTTPCVAGFLVTQAYDSTSTGGAEPIPNNVWVYNLSSGGTGSFVFNWYFGDGDSSSLAFPTHVYDGPGPYLLCLTVYSNSDLSCFDTYCDSISIDASGILNGMVIDGHHANSNHRTNGFTLNVVQPTPVGIAETPAIADLHLWPNPAQDELNLSFNNTMTGAVSVTVIDPSGRMVISESHNLATGSNTLGLNTGSLDPGLYMVRIGSGANSMTHRFMKIR